MHIMTDGDTGNDPSPNPPVCLCVSLSLSLSLMHRESASHLISVWRDSSFLTGIFVTSAKSRIHWAKLPFCCCCLLLKTYIDYKNGRAGLPTHRLELARLLQNCKSCCCEEEEVKMFINSCTRKHVNLAQIYHVTSILSLIFKNILKCFYFFMHFLLTYTSQFH